MQSSSPVVPPKTKTKQFKRKPGTGAQAPSLPNATEFSVCRNDSKEGGRRSPRPPNRLREPEAPPRPSAGESPRRLLPAVPLLRGKATPQLCARERLAPPAAPPPPAALLLLPAAGLPLCWNGALGAEERGWGTGATGGAPPPLERGSRPGTQGLALPRRRPRPAGPPARAAPALPLGSPVLPPPAQQLCSWRPAFRVRVRP